MRYIELATDIEVQRALAAAWRLWYAERLLYQQTVPRTLNAAAQAGCPAPVYGDPLGWDVRRRQRVWSKVACPKVQVLRDGAPGGCLAIAPERGDVISRIEVWAGRGDLIPIPSDATLASLQAVPNVRYEGRRARLLLGLRVDGQQVAVDRGVHAFQPAAIVESEGLSARWRGRVPDPEAGG